MTLKKGAALNRPESTNQLIDHFFRHQSGNLCARLTGFFGVRNIDLVEDMVQAALLTAAESWKVNGVPENPSGWIAKVAHNKVIDFLRREKRKKTLEEQEANLLPESSTDSLAEFDDENLFQDDLLKLIFACCQPEIPDHSSIPLTLKLVGGFSEKEIAAALLQSPESIKKRIYRAKKQMAENPSCLELPPKSQLPQRLQSVHHVLYLMFNQGYSPSDGPKAIRDDICEEATRLCHLLCKNSTICNGSTKALLALMLFQASRLDARIGSEGQSILLVDQDRNQWDQFLIRSGLHYLKESEREDYSSYHVEARIAMLHCIAKDFHSTDWKQIDSLYEKLFEETENPVYRINQAIAKSQFLKKVDLQDAMELLLRIKNQKQLQSYPWLDAAIGSVHQKAGNFSKAIDFFQNAMNLAKNNADKRLLAKEIRTCENHRN